MVDPGTRISFIHAAQDKASLSYFHNSSANDNGVSK
jgi:hypothetical protein